MEEDSDAIAETFLVSLSDIISDIYEKSLHEILIKAIGAEDREADKAMLAFFVVRFDVAVANPERTELYKFIQLRQRRENTYKESGTESIERPQGSMPPNNLPYIRNDFFTGRGGVLQEIRTEFESGGTLALTQTITGLGGLGKTQVALEYAYRYSAKYNYIWWVASETDASVLDSYRAFALGNNLIDEHQQNSDTITEAVLTWMDTHEKWLFIYDNVDANLRKVSWWPRNNKENILITTRNRKSHVGKSIDISTFPPEEAVSFLVARAGIDDERGAYQIAGRLGYFPLALEQAAAYIKINEVTFAEYLGLIDKFGLEVLEDTDGVIDYTRSIMATWEITFKKIDSEAARQLLYLCAYLASENINPALFSENFELLPPPLGDEMSHELKCNKVWSKLTEYSLMEKQDDGQGYSMHRLLQEVVRNKLVHEPLGAIVCLAIFEKAYTFEYGNVESHHEFLKNTPHVEALLSVAGTYLTDDDSQVKCGALYSEGGFGSIYLGDYHKAMDLYYKALAINERVLGKEHANTATTYNNIGGVYYNLGDYPNALDLYQKALVIREKVSGREHPDTAGTHNNIATVYSDQGDYDKALELYQKVLVIREKVSGREHPDTATTYNNIATVYSNQGNYDKALELYQKVLEINEKILGKEHPGTAMTYNNIASAYSHQGDHPKALKWYQKAFVIFEARLGKDHPKTKMVQNNIQYCLKQM